jgi:hypothetical protein
MRYRVFLLLLVAGLLVPGTAAYGHHSLSATYQAEKEIKLEGTLVQFVFRNPHSFVHIQAQDEKGETRRWAVEWTGAAALGSRGVQADSLRAGDHVIITGRPSRAPGETRVLMLSIWRPSDNFRWGRNPGEVVD